MPDNQRPIVASERQYRSDDYHSHDTWLQDRDPHYCSYCGFDILTKNPWGEQIDTLGKPKRDLEVAIDAPGKNGWIYPYGRWHPECAKEDERYKQILDLQRALDQGIRALIDSK